MELWWVEERYCDEWDWWLRIGKEEEPSTCNHQPMVIQQILTDKRDSFLGYHSVCRLIECTFQRVDVESSDGLMEQRRLSESLLKASFWIVDGLMDSDVFVEGAGYRLWIIKWDDEPWWWIEFCDVLVRGDPAKRSEWFTTAVSVREERRVTRVAKVTNVLLPVFVQTT